MRVRPAGTMPLERRRRIYVCFLSVGLLTLFAGTLASGWSIVNGGEPINARIPALAFAYLAAANLLWLRPRVIPYVLGAIALTLALTGWPTVWLGLLFPLAWIMLAASVSHWVVGVLSYLATGVTFLVITFVGGAVFLWPKPPVLPDIWTMLVFPLLWPAYSLAMVGATGWAPGWH